MKTRKGEHQMGRPSKLRKEIASAICEQIMGGDSVRKICAREGMPAMSTVFRRLAEDGEFSEQYAHAREAQAEFFADEIIDIADETPVTEQPDPDGGVTMRIDAAGVQRNKLRVDARKWVAAKLLPKKYGERTQVEHSGTVTLEQLVCGDVQV
jgi:hypothetical protein